MPRKPTTGSLAVQLVTLFAVVGLSLGISTVLFLQSSGVYRADASQNLLAAFTAGIVVVGVPLIAMMVGVVLAVFGALHVVPHATTKDDAVTASAAGAAIGHLVMVVLLVLVVMLASNVLAPAPAPGSNAQRSPLDFAAIQRIALGLFPAALAGGAVAYLTWKAPPEPATPPAAETPAVAPAPEPEHPAIEPPSTPPGA